ncbi:UNVERIFIED_CONTAM: hypothetical protein Sradi_6848700 [Sesamum radiatum]|uniref:Uncharacterized protein n=1 Tax=Sesamum radiatum TaxID=300843 RepID=A0AAW2JLQ6_SESRA
MGGDSQIYMDNLTHLEERRCGDCLGRSVVSLLGFGFVPEILMKIGASSPRRQIEEFRSCLSDCQLTDLGYLGYKYTWCNHHEAPDTVRTRLDRACASTGWRTKFPNSNVEAVAARGLDHNPLLINLEADKEPRHRQRQKIFRFEAMWT